MTKKLTTQKTNLDNLVNDITRVISESRNQIVKSINSTMIHTYFNIGKKIVEYDQKGFKRAEYALSTLKELSNRLSKLFGKGYSHDNLQNMRLFYLTYKNYDLVSDISKGVLSWSHFVKLVNIEDNKERKFYEMETVQNHWSIRELKRQYNSSFYERLALSKNKDEIKRLSREGQIIEKPSDLLKEPLVLEFLDLKEDYSYTEKDLETKLINNLQSFLLELGKGFAFVSRQQRISFGNKHFYIDLVFYNWILKCFVIIDLKIGELKHQDLGQIQMYTNFYDREIKLENDNKTIGIVLCKEKNNALVEYTLPKDNDQIFAGKYKEYLPSKKQLKEKLNSIDLDE